MPFSHRALTVCFLGGIAVHVTGCATPSSVQNSNFDLSPALATRVASVQPSFGVGDELGWMMFSQVALLPEASPARDVLVIAEAPVRPSFDWWGQVALQGW